MHRAFLSCCRPILSTCRTHRTFATKTKRLSRRPPPHPPLLFGPYLGPGPNLMSSTDNNPSGKVRTTLNLSDVEETVLPPSKKIRLHDNNKNLKRKTKKSRLPQLEKYSSEDVLWQDILGVLGKDVVDEAVREGTDLDSPYEKGEVVDVEVVGLSSTGEALATALNNENTNRPPWAIVTRFCLPGEKVRVRVSWNKRLHSNAELLEVLTPNLELRDDSRVKCKYFGQCGGCQYQMLSYDQQLKLKRDVVVRAYKNFSDLAPASIPTIQATNPSPLQYGYRTKLTPHFDAPPKAHRKQKADIVDDQVQKPEWLNIGFNKAGTHRVVDIEECPISTPVLNAALPSIREDIYRNIHKYEKGVSLILRDSLPIPNTDSSTSFEPVPPPPAPSDSDSIDALSTSLSEHVCISDPKSTVREQVGDFIFEYNANSFFQNNNSVLRPLTEYVRDAIFPPSSSSLASHGSLPLPKYLVDAYCGAGLFSITLSPYFSQIAGIELSSESIKAAQRNATLNSIPSSKITFRAGDAGDLFAAVRQDFPPSQTVLVIDPPRKGCDENFIKQVLEFRCGTIVYVSCNVHTQARDVGRLVNATKEDGDGRRYVLESLRGFDLFPQTAHIEGVAVLRLA